MKGQHWPRRARALEKEGEAIGLLELSDGVELIILGGTGGGFIEWRGNMHMAEIYVQ